MTKVPPRPWYFHYPLATGNYQILDAEGKEVTKSTNKEALELLVRLENEDFDKKRHKTEAISDHPYIFSIMQGKRMSKWTGRRRK